MQAFSLARILPRILTCVLGVVIASAAHAATTPGFTIKATNVSLNGQSTASTTFTLTSVGGYTGSVGVFCTGPNGNLYPDLVIPECAHPTEHLTIPANGSVKGTLSFYPPWKNENEAMLRGQSAQPVLAGLFVGVGLLGFGLRRCMHGRLSLLLGVFGIFLFSGAVGCLGHGGLQMTPGTYGYTLTATGTGVKATTTVNVTVHCSSCS